ncbi:7-methyl-GTP pyrophosphatase isoform X3 [Eucalyptus grandis]|uniref:7-methyl-GTP pyrophosphatase isoform X3 n=1 Tax=Eucalyptus grandis TaxID=71139 RepID=UPI00192ECEB0|nr:7-methyl-GTP pyrophosphatase isoform X3 [Eucalyptus grandis]
MLLGRWVQKHFSRLFWLLAVVAVVVVVQIILGSSSMPRQHILAEMGYDFTVMTADIDEKAIRKDKPEELVTALAEAKVVVHEGRIREKPSSKDEARNFIEGYSGGRAEVVGSVLVTNLKTGRREAGWERAEVYFYDIPAEVVQSLIDEGITLNVAGGLMLEHPLTSPIIKEVIGTADTIMGLPKSLTERLIQEALTRPSSEACRNPA